ncbi:MAG: nucleotidyltransferase domain-containing protein [Deltaproteobacteria bacterium]|nr:nucleotidyltransferase domain-containing protein [Deltaproteobacteria bacterium]
MPKAFSDSAEVTFLDRDEVLQKLKALAQEILNQSDDILEISLFGSLARGDHAPSSDADLLVVLCDSDVPMQERIPRFLRLFLEGPIEVDVFPYTQQEIAQRRATGDPWLAQILADKTQLAP